jgi:CRP-like cAMP-binding protein
VTLLETLNEAELFQGLGDPECRAIHTLARRRNAAAGEELFRHGEAARELYVIRRGRVELTFPIVVKGEARDTRFLSLEPGRTVAWSALVAPHHLTMGARASTDVELLGFDRSRLLDHFERNPSVGYVVMGNLSRVVAARLNEVVSLWVREIQRNVSHTYG